MHRWYAPLDHRVPEFPKYAVGAKSIPMFSELKLLKEGIKRQPPARLFKTAVKILPVLVILHSCSEVLSNSQMSFGRARWNARPWCFGARSARRPNPQLA